MPSNTVATMPKSVVDQPDTLLRYVMGAKAITVDIPGNATLDTVMPEVERIAGAMRTMMQATEKLKPVLGRILLEIQTRKLYKARYPHFQKFLESEILNGKLRIGRSTAFEAMRIARAFPSLNTDEYARIGATKLLEASHYVTEARSPLYREVLNKFETMPTVEAAKQWAESEGLKPKKATSTVTWTVRLTAESKSIVDDFFADPKVQKWAGAENHEVIFRALVDFAKLHVPDLASPVLAVAKTATAAAKPAGKPSGKPVKPVAPQQPAAAAPMFA